MVDTVGTRETITRHVFEEKALTINKDQFFGNMFEHISQAYLEQNTDILQEFLEGEDDRLLIVTGVGFVDILRDRLVKLDPAVRERWMSGASDGWILAQVGPHIYKLLANVEYKGIGLNEAGNNIDHNVGRMGADKKALQLSKARNLIDYVNSLKIEGREPILRTLLATLSDEVGERVDSLQIDMNDVKFIYVVPQDRSVADYVSGHDFREVNLPWSSEDLRNEILQAVT